jgi:hypothetical protein
VAQGELTAFSSMELNDEESLDMAAVWADDALLDAIGAGRLALSDAHGDWLVACLVAWSEQGRWGA